MSWFSGLLKNLDVFCHSLLVFKSAAAGSAASALLRQGENDRKRPNISRTCHITRTLSYNLFNIFFKTKIIVGASRTFRGPKYICLRELSSLECPAAVPAALGHSEEPNPRASVPKVSGRLQNLKTTQSSKRLYKCFCSRPENFGTHINFVPVPKFSGRIHFLNKTIQLFNMRPENFGTPVFCFRPEFRDAYIFFCMRPEFVVYYWIV